jgi:hypothetical protein
MKNLLKLSMVLAASTLFATSAHARLGWTLDDCQEQWGAPISVDYDKSVGTTSYVFRSSAKLYVQLYLLNGQVQSLGYLSRDKKFLQNNAQQILEKNLNDGMLWTLYDDGRGKETLSTWQYKDQSDEILAYALLFAKPTVKNSYYELRVSSSRANLSQNVNGSGNLNI